MSQVMKPADIARLRQVGNPRVSPDGAAVAFTVADPDLEANRYTRRIWLAPADADDGGPRPFTGPGSEVLPRWSPDGQRLAYREFHSETGTDIWTLPLDTSDPDHPKPGKPEAFLVTPADEL